MTNTFTVNYHCDLFTGIIGNIFKIIINKSKMKHFLILVIVFFLSFNSYSQTYSCQLVDIEIGLPIPYANIGIINKNIGTVSNAKEWLTIELDNEFDNDSLRISCIGYESRIYLIHNFKNIFRNTEQITIELKPKIYQLEEIIVKPIDLETYTLGNFCEADSRYGNSFPSKNLGMEIGVMIKLPEDVSKAYLK